MEDEFGFKIISYVWYDEKIGQFEVIEPERFKRFILKFLTTKNIKEVFSEMQKLNILHFINKKK